MRSGPQLENGYLRVANEIWDALGMFKVTKNQRAALWLILRMSYGCQQKACQFGEWRDFAKCADINEGEVKGVIRSLEEAQVIAVDRQHKVIAFNKNYDLWMLPVSDFDALRYANLIKQNLKYRAAISDYAEALFSEFGKTRVDSEKPNQGAKEFGKTESAIRKNRTQILLIEESVRAEVHRKDILKTVDLNTISARAREGKSKADIIDDWLHKINLEAGEDIANKGAEDYEEMCFILSSYSWEEEVAPAIKESEGTHFAERLRSVVRKVTGEDYG